MGVEFFDTNKILSTIQQSDTLPLKGEVARVVGLTVEAKGPAARIGDLCTIRGKNHEIECEVVGFNDDKVLLMPLGELNQVAPGDKVVTSGKSLSVPVGPGLAGRVLDGLGRPIDGKGPLKSITTEYQMENTPPAPLDRSRIKQPLQTGVRSIDGMLTIGEGQRMGIFAGSGVGKSTLLGMIARSTSADINVIGLIGERGREVREFIDKDLGSEGLKNSVVVVATSDQPALLRIKGALTATAIAEYFRDNANNVMLMMDSLTRFATAKREVGLATGEPPATRGFPPSVFATLPRLLERSGTSSSGNITGLYTVLVDGDDMDEPVSDTVRGVLDGHIVLSRKLAVQNHYPAIDILESISRVMVDIVNDKHQQAANRINSALAAYEEARDLIEIGAYQSGSNPKVDWALELIEDVNDFLQQEIDEECNYDDTVNKLISFLDN